MENPISCCGLNCSSCDAYIATINDDNDLRASTVVKWQKMFDSPFILPEDINCLGCREDGIKLEHCYNCEIRVCVAEKGFNTCINCNDMDLCDKLAVIHQHSPEALKNLKSLN